jgi:hypothetical protein
LGPTIKIALSNGLIWVGAPHFLTQGWKQIHLLKFFLFGALNRWSSQIE